MGNSFRQTFAGIFARQEMDANQMLSGHLQSTLSGVEASESEYIIAAQDTTYYNYSGQRAMEGLGEIQGKVRGLLQHNVLLLDQVGLPLGLLAQQYWTRNGGQDLPPEEKESNKWHKGLSAINEHLCASSKTIVAVEDREGDIFSFFRAERQPNVELLVRVHQPRPLEVIASQQLHKLPQVYPHLGDYGQLSVTVERQNRAVQLVLNLRAGAVNVYPDQDLSSSQHKTQGWSLVVAQEVACIDLNTQQVMPPPETPAVWYLLSSLPTDSLEQVQRIVHFYALRWRIERFHYTLKSGALNVETWQFDDIHTLINSLAFYSVVAWRLLALTYAIRADPTQPAYALFDSSELLLLQTFTSKPIVSLGDAVLALARVVGFAPSKKQPFPGVKVLATALERFAFASIGFQSAIKPLQD
ncbi:MAG: IS4 family transposase [Leptolyngbyaceae cyanobacterium RM1_406_9]|nr:IS4 family transposase [Leptolyngbyaceae cyanobacterium RM1_406_9]